MLISKSLFVDYKDLPKLAWWKYNNLDIYKKIKWLDNEETSDNLIELWQKVEDLVWEYFLRTEWLNRLNVFEENTAKNPLDEEDEDIYIVQENYIEKRERNLKQTIEAIKNKEPLIYQPWFLYDWLFVRWDYLKLNVSWNYDLIEVKAKTSVRNINKTKVNLKTNFIDDISFQKYVINKVFEENNLWNIENYYFAYLNKNYKKNWPIDIIKIITIDQVDIIQNLPNSEWDLIKNDDLLHTYWVIEWTIKQIREELLLDEAGFNKIHPFSWSRYVDYFWKDREFWTIFWKWLTSPNAISKLYTENKIYLEELALEEQELFNTAKWEIWTARKYVNNYLEAKKEWSDLIDEDSIRNELNNLKFPICFYDYETCCVPIPFLDNTSPYQQTVVQYSLHKLYEDWDIKHYWWVLVWTWEHKVEQINIQNNKNAVNFESEKVITWNYKDLFNEFIKDIWEDLDKTFIVWYKAFENTRNKETAEIFEDLKDKFEMINENTYDLMDIFKKDYYYSLNFKGSNSIKYVLPAMVPDMSYEWMEVPNWLIAMQVLNNIIEWNIVWEEKDEQIKNLLLYCGQDSLAMYKIYSKIIEKINT